MRPFNYDTLTEISLEFIDEIRRSSISLPESAQNKSLDWLASQYRNLYRRTFPEDVELKNFNRTFKDPDFVNVANRMHAQVANIPTRGLFEELGGSRMGQEVEEAKGLTQRTRSGFLKGLDMLRRTNTAKDLRGVLAQSFGPAISQMAGIQAGKGRDPHEVYSEATEKMIGERFPTFDPRRGSALGHIVHGIQKATTALGRGETQIERAYSLDPTGAITEHRLDEMKADPLRPVVTKRGTLYPRIFTIGGTLWSGKTSRNMMPSLEKPGLPGSLQGQLISYPRYSSTGEAPTPLHKPLFVPSHEQERLNIMMRRTGADLRNERLSGARSLRTMLAAEKSLTGREKFQLPIDAQMKQAVGGSYIDSSNVMPTTETRSEGPEGFGYDPAIHEGPKDVSSYKYVPPDVSQVRVWRGETLTDVHGKPLPSHYKVSPYIHRLLPTKQVAKSGFDPQNLTMQQYNELQKESASWRASEQKPGLPFRPPAESPVQTFEKPYRHPTRQYLPSILPREAQPASVLLPGTQRSIYVNRMVPSSVIGQDVDPRNVTTEQYQGMRSTMGLRVRKPDQPVWQGSAGLTQGRTGEQWEQIRVQASYRTDPTTSATPEQGVYQSQRQRILQRYEPSTSGVSTRPTGATQADSLAYTPVFTKKRLPESILMNYEREMGRGLPTEPLRRQHLTPAQYEAMSSYWESTGRRAAKGDKLQDIRVISGWSRTNPEQIRLGQQKQEWNLENEYRRRNVTRPNIKNMNPAQYEEYIKRAHDEASEMFLRENREDPSTVQGAAIRQVGGKEGLKGYQGTWRAQYPDAARQATALWRSEINIADRVKVGLALEHTKGDVWGAYNKYGNLVQTGTPQVIQELAKTQKLSTKVLRGEGTVSGTGMPAEPPPGNLDYITQQQVSATPSGEFKSRGTILAEADRFIKKMPLGRDMMVTVDNKLKGETLARYEYTGSGKGVISLSNQFFDDKVFAREIMKTNYGDLSADTMRKHVLAHEIGHGLAGSALNDAAKAHLKDLQKINPEKYDKLVADAPPKYKSRLHKELAADIVGSTLGYTNARLENRYGVTADKLYDLQKVAVGDMQKRGIVTAEGATRQLDKLQKGTVAYDEPFISSPLNDPEELERQKRRVAGRRTQVPGGQSPQTPTGFTGSQEGHYEPTQKDQEWARSEAAKGGPVVGEPDWLKGKYKHMSGLREKWRSWSPSEQSGFTHRMESAITAGRFDATKDLGITDATRERQMASAYLKTKDYLLGEARPISSTGGSYSYITTPEESPPEGKEVRFPDPKKRIEAGGAQTPEVWREQAKRVELKYQREAVTGGLYHGEEVYKGEVRATQDYIRHITEWEPPLSKGETRAGQAFSGGKPHAVLGIPQKVGTDIAGKDMTQFVEPLARKELVGDVSESKDPKTPMRFFAKEAKPGVVGEKAVTMDWQHTRKAEQVFAQAKQYATESGGYTGMNPQEVAATFKQRMSDASKNWFDKFEQETTKSGDAGAIATAREMRPKMEAAVNKMIYGRIDALTSDPAGKETQRLRGRPGDLYPRASLGTYAQNIRYAAISDPQLAKMVADQGGAEAVAGGAVQVRTTSKGAYSMGGMPPVMGGGFGGRAPREPGDPGRGGRKGMWGGSAGSMLYGAYIAKRMWSWTAAPVIKDAQAYGTTMGSMAPLTTEPIAGTAVGYGARAAIGKMAMGEGAYQQFGGFMDYPYSLSDSGAGLGRMQSGLSLAAGVAGAGYMLGASSQLFAKVPGMAGMAAGGVAAGTVGLGIGAAVGLTVTAMEIANATILKDASPNDKASLGNAWRQGANIFNRLGAAREMLKELGVDAGIADVWQVAQTGDVENYMTQAQIDYGKGKIWTPETERLQKLATGMSRLTGEDPTAVQPALRAMARLGGGRVPDYDLAKSWAQASIRANMTSSEYASQATTIFGQMGLVPGSAEGNLLVRQMGNIQDPAQLAQLASTAGRTASMAGQLAPYLGSTYAASELVREMNITTAQEVQPIQQLLAKAALQGVDLETPIGPTAREVRGAVSSGDFASRLTEITGTVDVVGMSQELSRITGVTDPSRTTHAPAVMAGSESEMASAYASHFLTEKGKNVAFGLAKAMPAVTQAQKLAEYADRLGAKPAMVAATAADFLADKGVPFMQGLDWVERMGIRTTTDWGKAQTMIQSAAQFGDLTQGQLQGITGMSQNVSQWQAATISSWAPKLGLTMGAGQVADTTSALAGAGMTNADMSLMNRMFAGDISAWSKESWVTGDPTYRFLDQGGMPIVKTSGTEFFQMFAGQVGAGSYGAQRQANLLLGRGGMSQAGGMGMPSMPTVTPGMLSSAIFGPGEEDAQAAFMQGGTIGYSAFHAKRMAGFQMASAGLAIKGINMQREMLWGGGEWTGTPAQGSMWAMQDEMTGLRHQAQMGDFRAQRWRLDTQNRFGINRENIQQQRMQVGQRYQNWQFGFQAQGMAQQQQWSRQDWQYQDTMRSLGIEWQLEDFDEAMRTTHGRGRRKIIRDRDRFATKTSLEGEQIQTQRGRQEESWKREEQQFEKQKEYAQHLMQLDKKSFELNKNQRETFYAFERKELARKQEEYMAQFALEEEMRELQRDHQAAMLDLQEQQAGIQAAAAAATIEYAENMTQIEGSYTEINTSFENMMRNDPTAALVVLERFGVQLGKTNPLTLEYLEKTMRQIASPSMSTNALRMTLMYNSLSEMNLNKINALIRLIAMLTAMPAGAR